MKDVTTSTAKAKYDPKYGPVSTYRAMSGEHRACVEDSLARIQVTAHLRGPSLVTPRDLTNTHTVHNPTQCRHTLCVIPHTPTTATHVVCGWTMHHTITGKHHTYNHHHTQHNRHTPT